MKCKYKNSERVALKQSDVVEDCYDSESSSSRIPNASPSWEWYNFSTLFIILLQTLIALLLAIGIVYNHSYSLREDTITDSQSRRKTFSYVNVYGPHNANLEWDIGSDTGFTSTYLLGTLSQHYQLNLYKALNESIKFTVLLMAKNENVEEFLKCMGINIAFIPERGKTIMDAYHQLNYEGRSWPQTLYKLYVLNMTTFDKVISLDMDILIRQPSLNVFHKTAPAGVVYDGNHFNSGFVLFEPSHVLFQQVIESLKNVTRQDMEKFGDGNFGDQELMSWFFAKEKIPFTSIDKMYNQKRFDDETPSTDYVNVHFTICKPTRVSCNNTGRAKEFEQEFWEQSFNALQLAAKSGCELPWSLNKHSKEQLELLKHERSP